MQHASDFFGIRDHLRRVLLGHDSDSLPEFHLRLQFVIRAVRVPQMVDVFRGVMPSKPFSDVSRNRDTRLADFVTEHELVVPRKPR